MIMHIMQCPMTSCSVLSHHAVSYVIMQCPMSSSNALHVCSTWHALLDKSIQKSRISVVMHFAVCGASALEFKSPLTMISTELIAPAGALLIGMQVGQRNP